MLAYMSADEVPAKGIQLEVAIQNSQVDVRKANQPQKVSRSL